MIPNKKVYLPKNDEIFFSFRIKEAFAIVSSLRPEMREEVRERERKRERGERQKKRKEA